MSGENVEIIQVRDIPSGQPMRVGRLDTLVIYKVNDQPPDMVYVPKENFSEEALKVAIKGHEQEKVNWAGKRLTL